MDAGVGEAAIIASLASAGSEAAVAGTAGVAASGGLSAGTLASGASIASAGFGGWSNVMKGQGTKAADDMQADRLTRAAEFGKLQAGLTDTTMREQLNTTLGNIDVIRAAAHIDPTSPTSAAIREHETMISDRQRTAALLNIHSQTAEDEASAAYLRKAGNFALMQGYLGAGASVAGAAAKGLSVPGKAA